MSTEVFGFGLRLCAFVHSGEVVSRRARVQSQVERSEPESNLDGFLARLHDSPSKRRQKLAQEHRRMICSWEGHGYDAKLKEGLTENVRVNDSSSEGTWRILRLWLLMLLKECTNVFYKVRTLNRTGMTGTPDDLIVCVRKGFF